MSNVCQSHGEWYRPIRDAYIREHKDVKRERAVRLYCSKSFDGGTWCLQVRAPERLANGAEGKRFMIASSTLDRDAMVSLRDAIDAQLAALREGEEAERAKGEAVKRGGDL